MYRNDPKFSDRLIWANSADPVRSSLIRVFTVCYSICIFLTKYPKVWPLCLRFRWITSNFSGVQKFRNFTVIIIIMFLQVSAAKKMLFAPVARDPDFEYGAKFWCYFCEMEYGKHKVMEMTTVLAAGLLEHIARYTVQFHIR